MHERAQAAEHRADPEMHLLEQFFLQLAAQRRRRRVKVPVGMEPLSPRRKWRAITVATLVLVPAYWMLLAGIVS
mgnify:CR=1 FL=1